MKRLLLFACAAVIVSCSSQPKVKPAEEPGNKAALAAMQNEPKAQDFIITDANVLYISVDDDGTKRDGLAGYFCQILQENKATCRWVKVVQAGTTSEENGYGTLLGEAKCD